MKPRLLVTISYSFSIRYIVRSGLLHKLREFCTPVVGITWNQQDLIDELRGEGIEVHVLPEAKKDIIYTNIRGKIDIWFDHFMLQSPSKGLQQKYLDQFLPFKKKAIRKARYLYNVCKFYLPGKINQLFRDERSLLNSHTNYSEFASIVDTLNIDAVFTLTPFHQQEDILLRVCKDKGKMMLTAILSFDNITKRGWIPVEYDAYLLWNKYNKEELFRIYPYTKQRHVNITGAVQFDFYFQDTNLLSLQEWKKIVGIDANETRKIILYAGGPGPLFPKEPVILKHINEAIESGAIKDAIVLFRCHPIDNIERWKSAVGPTSHIVFDHSWTGKQKAGYANLTDADIKKLCSTLAYSDVHVNLCSTMTVDGSAYYKPQIGPCYVENDTKASTLLKGLYYQEHFLPIMRTKGLLLAESKQELVSMINNCLLHPEDYVSRSEDILKEIITYTDGKSLNRVVDILRKELTNQPQTIVA